MYKIIGADKQEYGPVTADLINQWITQGRADGNTIAKAEGTEDWQPLAAFPEFSAALATKTSPTQRPPAVLSPPAGAQFVDVEAMAQQINARIGQLQVFDCLSRGMDLVFKNFWLSVGVCFVGTLIINVPVAGTVLFGTVHAGFFYLFLKLLRGEKAEFGDGFAGFSFVFVPSLLAGILTMVLVSLGLLFCIIPGIFLIVVWMFTWPLIMDKRLDAWQAMEVSRKICTPQFWPLLGLLIMNVLVYCLGILACCVGTLVAYPIMIAATAIAYESVVNPQS
ncbi:MAG: GYF domain-containing protein [Verrucomicrobiota bacterium]